MPKFNLRLRELRKQEKLTQQDLANYLGISKSSVNMYERGEREPGLDLLEAIADFFNVNVDYLMGKSNDPINYDDNDLIAEIPEELVRFFGGNIKKAYKAWQARIAPPMDDEISDIVNSLDQADGEIEPGLTPQVGEALTSDEQFVVDSMRTLNDSGIEYVVKQAKFAAEQPEYKKGADVSAKEA